MSQTIHFGTIKVEKNFLRDPNTLPLGLSELMKGWLSRKKSFEACPRRSSKKAKVSGIKRNCS